MIGGQAYQNPHLDIHERRLETVPERLIFTVNPVVLTNVFFKSPDSHGCFLFIQPTSCAREIGQQEIGTYGNCDCDGAFDDEEPSPSAQPTGTVHVVLDSSGDEA